MVYTYIEKLLGEEDPGEQMSPDGYHDHQEEGEGEGCLGRLDDPEYCQTDQLQQCV